MVFSKKWLLVSLACSVAACSANGPVKSASSTPPPKPSSSSPTPAEPVYASTYKSPIRGW
jgi:hypothetical protein